MDEKTKLKKVMDLIDKLAEPDDSDDIARLELEIREITGKSDLSANECKEYWGWTSLEELAKRFLLPTPQAQGLSDEELAIIVEKIANVEYSESEMDYQLDVLAKETGLINVSDYIFYPNLIGLELNADVQEIIDKILADRMR
ncbi:hypothetical protein V1226_23400 [Lachnospiraceae bacterium JLR.KK009]|jgi:hypothetical protein|nr:hypothetical protein C810_03695 [Lachnospiraceae bacterium A2]GFI19004.1 hypothetical protein IMSAGC009_04184 [Lachnospiraceae bacterium]